MSTNSPQTYRFIIMTVDPVHIGTGGMRLGRVDNAILREAGTNLPKIPGTALHGVIRGYAARRFGKPQCAGQGGRENKHCGRPTCPICYTFGSIQGKAGSFSGVVSIYDARILLFPVYSMVGPVWVTTPNILKNAGITKKENINVEPEKVILSKGVNVSKHINLGWLMLEKENSQTEMDGLFEEKFQIPKEVKERIVLVHDSIFPQIVNSNLEVRTSVAINPATGAAEEGALFTYEALPRTTFLWFDVVVDDFRGNFPSKNKLGEWENILNDGNKEEQKNLLRKWKLLSDEEPAEEIKAIEKAKSWINEEKPRWENLHCCPENNGDALCVVKSGLEWAEYLGIGGMGTRGFGRIRKMTICEVRENGIENCNNGGKNDQTNS